MPELVEQMYCSQQIVVPPKFPYIIKKFAKAAIKTQPYDLLRWSCEYFQALAAGRTPPVKLRLEYPVFSSSGGLTAGYLRMLYQQLKGEEELQRAALERAWRGACLDPLELARVLCLCDAWRPDAGGVPTDAFFAVAAGFLTKSLTQTMILLCETMTREPDGGSAAVPAPLFLRMYELLARLDAGADVRYADGVREGHATEPPPPEEEQLPEVESIEELDVTVKSSEEFYVDGGPRRSLPVTGERYAQPTRLSNCLSSRLALAIQRSPSAERDAAIVRHERTRRPDFATSEMNIDNKLRELSRAMLGEQSNAELDGAQEGEEKKRAESKRVKIVVTDENDQEIPLVIFGDDTESVLSCNFGEEYVGEEVVEEDAKETEQQRVASMLEEHRQNRLRRIEDLEQTFDELAAIVLRWKYLNYDLGMIAGRQMSTGSGEFIAQSIERDIMAVINEQIGILPDPDLKKKKAKPEEVAMVRGILENFVDENMELIVPEQEVEEEEEEEQPEVVVVYAVPGIGPPVPEQMIAAVAAHVSAVSDSNEGLFMPRNIRHFLCPPLEVYTDPLDSQENELMAE